MCLIVVAVCTLYFYSESSEKTEQIGSYLSMTFLLQKDETEMISYSHIVNVYKNIINSSQNHLDK